VERSSKAWSDESGPDFGAAVGILAEDLAWLAFASKVPDGQLN